jgi:hypothetical protein
MLAGLTKGELQDIQQEHNAKIKAALASARAEISLSKERCGAGSQPKHTTCTG